MRLPKESWETIRDHAWTDYRIEVPVFTWNDQPLIHVSMQAYNTPEDMERLLGAIEKYL